MEDREYRPAWLLLGANESCNSYGFLMRRPDRFTKQPHLCCRNDATKVHDVSNSTQTYRSGNDVVT